MSARAEGRIRRREQRRRRRAFRRALRRAPWMDLSPEAPWFAAMVAWIAFRWWGSPPPPRRVPLSPDDVKR